MMLNLKNFAVAAGMSVIVGGAAIGGQTVPSFGANAPISEMTRISYVNDGQERSFKAYMTGYSFWDNTPPGSAAIARPVIHRSAGGTGTFNDPITIAVGHSIVNGRQTLDFPAGTRFYIGAIQKYAIVEDVCGDGPTPQAGPCHSGYNGVPWLDIYVGGQRAGVERAQECARRITAIHTFIVNPRPGYPVLAGEIANNCQILSS